MAQRRIRCWFQFGILDLLLLTTVVAIVAVLSRGVQAKVVAAPPWVGGIWTSSNSTLLLLPDGRYCSRDAWPSNDWKQEGVVWTTELAGGMRDAFVLKCGKRQFMIRQDQASGAVFLFEEKSGDTLYQCWRFEGATSGGKPHGTWRLVGAGVTAFWTLAYRNGELVDLHGQEGQRDWRTLNEMRRGYALAALTERDFPDEGATEEKAP